MSLPTLTILMMFPLIHILFSLFLAFYLLINFPIPMVTYLTFIYFDRSPARGGYAWARKLGLTLFLRRLFLWRLAGSYFPIHQYKTCDLAADVPYVFACHPHGIIACSFMGSFGTDLTNVSKLFPGVDIHLLGLKALFYVPFFREFVLLHGHATPGGRTITNALSGGRSVAVAIGGAAESLDAHNHETCLLTLQNRKGFVKLVLRDKKAQLVPVFSFGENELYHTIPNPEGSWLRSAQNLFKRYLGFTFPLFYGRWWNPVLPLRKPLHVWVGKPLAVPYDPDPSNEMINFWHQRYMDALLALVEEHKAELGYPKLKVVFK